MHIIIIISIGRLTFACCYVLPAADWCWSTSMIKRSYPMSAVTNHGIYDLEVHFGITSSAWTHPTGLLPEQGKTNRKSGTPRTERYSFQYTRGFIPFIAPKLRSEVRWLWCLTQQYRWELKRKWNLPKEHMINCNPVINQPTCILSKWPENLI